MLELMLGALRKVRCRCWALGLALAPLASAQASNGNKPRVQVRWPAGAECIQTVDKAKANSIRFAYDFNGPDDIPPIDSVDEVEDSRRHQFFAMCRHRHRQEILPRWISQRDFDRAKAFGYPNLSPGLGGILDHSPDWGNCALRINGDDARRPITHALAQRGISWELGSIPSASYVINGYTWEPPENLWSQPSRPGVVRIWDSRSESSPPPAAALDAIASIGYLGQSQNLAGCIAADPGSTIEWSIAELPPLGVPPQWFPLGAAEPAIQGRFNREITPPAPTVSYGVSKWMLRLVVRDPQGRSYTAYSRSDILVLDQSGDQDFEYLPPPPKESSCDFNPKRGSWPFTAFVLFLMMARRGSKKCHNRRRMWRSRT